MQLKIETEMSGNFSIEKDMETKLHPYTIDIRFESDKDQHFISLKKKIYDYAKFLPKLGLDKNRIESIIFPKEDFIQEQIGILKHIETFGAIDIGIKKINWPNCTIEWIPENEEELKELPIRKYNRDLTYDPRRKILKKDWLFNTVCYRKQLEHLSLPLAFYRTGVNRYYNFQYQESFINFYLMLEGLFGNGQFKNEKIKSEFRKSVILLKAIGTVIKILENSKNKHHEWLTQICKKYNKQVDEYGVIHILVELRGNLSHFSFNEPIKNRNPFMDRDFDSLAYIVMSISLFATNDIRLEPFRAEKLNG